MSTAQKITVYLIGVIIGVMLLRLMPKPQVEENVHPWHEQTAPIGMYPMEFADDYGRTVKLDRQPRHLVSLAPSVTDTLFAMGMGDHLMGVTDWCVVPEGGRERVRIGNLDTPNGELIATLPVDLIIGSNLTPRRVYETIGTERKPAVMLDFESYEAFLASVNKLGQVLGVPKYALKLTNELEARKQAVLERAKKHEGPQLNVLFLYDMENLYSAGKGAWTGDFIEMLGAVNIAAKAPSAWPQLSREYVLAAPIDVIVYAGSKPMGKNPNDEGVANEVPAFIREVIRSKGARLELLPDGLFTVPGPKMLDALEMMGEAIYPQG